LQASYLRLAISSPFCETEFNRSILFW
jgi:hypothetical protein